ncbi:DUF6005 family protein [Paenibacillus sp. 2TAB23]|uniref:DUF6005 family protein n=1 Tax=Paenibacillus sp. 2TAB23 TaxID=3233004 RepID=UPI003F95A62B
MMNQPLEGEESIKVHCLISCLCEIVKRNSSVDYRPFYFGVWDGDFVVNENEELSYFSKDITHEAYLNWYTQLFGLPVKEWYDFSRSKAYNVEVLLQLLEEKPAHRSIIVHIDMALMPERENKFHQKPFPHFLMIEKTDNEDEWFMCDPDFRWEGIVRRERVLEAIRGNAFGGGYYIDAIRIQEPARENVEQLFLATFKGDRNELTAQIRGIVARLSAGGEAEQLRRLTPSLRQLKVLAIRKYGYEHAFMYLMPERDPSDSAFIRYSDLVEELVQGYTTVQYLAIKLATTYRMELVETIHTHLDRLDDVEKQIKQGLEQFFFRWREHAAVEAGGPI